MSDLPEYDYVPAHDIVVPFVVTQGHGGPFDDEAYAAGYSLGYLDAQLAIAKAMNLGTSPCKLDRRNMPQVELLAMKHRAQIHEIPVYGVDADWIATWVCLLFQFVD